MLLKKAILVLAVISFLTIDALPSAASAPYESYTYNYYEDGVRIPAPFLPERSVSGADLGVGDFIDPNDMYVTADGRIYILDSGNRRIISLDKNWRLIREITVFDNNGKEDGFANPGGIFVTEDKRIFVADTERQRIVVLTNEGELVKIIENPESDILPQDFKFVPLKVTVDKANRVFVVARGVFEGLMQFDENGAFIGYVGTINLTQNLWDKIWRLVATDTQKRQMRLYIPTEFVSVDIDRKGFVYSTNIDLETQKPVKRLNPSGQDVLKRFGRHPVVGDVRYRVFGNNAGPSKLVDIKVLGDGMYTVLDSFRGRLFTYNDEGELLYVFGGKGTQLGTFKTPVAIEQAGDKLVVLDRGKNSITVFKPTAFGRSVHQAVRLQYNGNDAESVKAWKEALRMNANYDIAYIGIGKAMLMEKKNKEAMEYFKLGMQRKYYSVAYKRYRREVMKEHFGTFLTVLMAAIASLAAFRLTKKWRTRRVERREAGLY